VSGIVAENVRRWRVTRGLDQQGLADRLAELGWDVDRTATTRIGRGDRKVKVDDLGLLAAALLAGFVGPRLLGRWARRR
jgi:hypothetical protein